MQNKINYFELFTKDKVYFIIHLLSKRLDILLIHNISKRLDNKFNKCISFESLE